MRTISAETTTPSAALGAPRHDGTSSSPGLAGRRELRRPLVAVLALALFGFGCRDGGSAGSGGGAGGGDGFTGCPSGTQDADEDGVCEPDCASTACGHGTCEESAVSGLATCICDAGFNGDACNELNVPSTEGVALWLDAADDDSFAFHSGQAVDTWTDRSAAALEAASVDAGTAPTRVAGALNGRPVVRFDGVDDELVMPGVAAFGEPTQGNYTLFMVVRTAEDDGEVFYAESANETLRLTAYDSVGDGTPALELEHYPVTHGFAVDVAAQGSAYGEPGWTHSEYHLVTFQRTHEGLIVWVDGNNQVSVYDSYVESHDQTLDDVLTLTLSHIPIAMDLAEMIVVSDDLQYDERLPYEEYLAAKWFGADFERTATAFGEAVIWLDAQDAEGITVASGGVTSWANRGVDGGYFANGSFADARPTYVAEGLGGRPVVRFDGGDALGQNTIAIDDGAVRGEYAMILVIDPPETGSRQLAFRGDRASDEGTIFQLDLLPDVPSLEFVHRVPPGDVGGEVCSSPADFGAPRIVIVERSREGFITIRIDDSTEVFDGDPDTGLLGTTTNWMLGGDSIADPGEGLVGDVAELIVMSDRLLEAEEEGLVEMLREKWGL